VSRPNVQRAYLTSQPQDLEQPSEACQISARTWGGGSDHSNQPPAVSTRALQDTNPIQPFEIDVRRLRRESVVASDGFSALLTGPLHARGVPIRPGNDSARALLAPCDCRAFERRSP